MRFESWFLILILLVGRARLIMSLAGVPNSTAKFFSLTVVFLLGMLYYSVRVYTSGFGSTVAAATAFLPWFNTGMRATTRKSELILPPSPLAHTGMRV
jgi:hypothetical protein